jgi:putative ABC transport system permease protein
MLLRLLGLLRQRRLDRELDDEIQAHLELAEKDAIAAGMTPQEAHDTARRRFGGIDQMKEDHRDHRSVRWIENLVSDARYGLASLRRDPGFAATVIAVLALGIGANAAMFSLVDGILLKPLPFPHPERVVSVREAPTPTTRNGITTLNFVDWKRLNTVFEALSAEDTTRVAVTIGGEPSPFVCTRVSADYFQVFAVNALLGRTFATGEDELGAPNVVVLSHATWRTRFGADPTLVNREILMDGEPHQVIGVLPPGYFDRGLASMWKPLRFDPEQLTRGHHWLSAVGRLREGVTLEQARSEMNAVAERLVPVNPPSKKDWRVGLDPFGEGLVGERLRRSIHIAFGAVALVLLIACANVASLLLAKGAARKKEMALRTALGASRGRLVAQLLTEGLVLCLLGGAAGVALAFLLVRTAVPALSMLSLPPTADIGVDLRVMGFAAGIALAVSLLVGLIPSLEATSGRLSSALNQGARGSSGPRKHLRRAIVAGEVAVSFVLVCGALLLFKSLLKVQEVEAGVRIQNVVTMATDLPMAAYPTPESAVAFFRTVVERLEATPGIERAAVSSDVPLLGVRGGEGLQVPGKEGGLGVRFKRVDAGYFATLEIPVLFGRGIGHEDHASAPPVVVINQELARRLRGDLGIADPVGKMVALTSPRYVKQKDAPRGELQIVGVIRDERVGGLQDPQAPVVYVPLAQVPRPEVKLIVRTRGDPGGALKDIQEAVRQVDPNLALGDIRTMEQVRERSLSGTKQPAWVVGAFAAVAALLAALGLYGVLSHLVTQQRREIGIRMALGARPRDVLALVLGNASSMVGVGLALGLLGAFAITKAIRGVLFEVSPLDPAAFAVASASMVLIAMGAGLVPAGRAARVDPVDVLRDEG